MVDPSVSVHPQAICESDAVGAGTRIWAFAHVLAGAVVGAGCNLCDGVFVEGGATIGDGATIKNGVMVWDGVTIEDDVFVGPGAVFTNDLAPRADLKKSASEFVPTRVGAGATIGANATIVCGITIGTRAFVGAGSVVVGDVAAHAFVVGNPARQIGWACTCARRLPETLVCDCGRRFRHTDAGGVDEIAR